MSVSKALFPECVCGAIK